jgi:hypothetical protein
MKRLALSILGGFLIPFVYTITTAPLTTYTENLTIHHLTYIPIGWPKLILHHFIPWSSFPFRDRDETALLIYMVGCDVIFYSLITYVLLLGFAKRKTIKQTSLPPLPK